MSKYNCLPRNLEASLENHLVFSEWVSLSLILLWKWLPYFMYDTVLMQQCLILFIPIVYSPFIYKNEGQPKSSNYSAGFQIQFI